MSYISDFKGSPFSLFGAKGGVNPTVASDASPTTLCGARFSTADGRELVLVQSGAIALVAGNLIQAPATIGGNHTGLTCATAAIGATTITVTLGGTAVTANQYAGGFAVVSAGTGIGQTLRINSHPAQATVNGTVVLTLEDPLSVATAVADSKVSLTLNPCVGVVISPTAATGATVGVTVTPIPASSYGFLVKRGLVACLNDSATAVGLDVMPSSAVPGAVVTYAVATRNRIGTSTVAGENTKAQLITVQL